MREQHAGCVPNQHPAYSTTGRTQLARAAGRHSRNLCADSLVRQRDLPRRRIGRRDAAASNRPRQFAGQEPRTPASIPPGKTPTPSVLTPEDARVCKARRRSGRWKSQPHSADVSAPVARCATGRLPSGRPVPACPVLAARFLTGHPTACRCGLARCVTVGRRCGARLVARAVLPPRARPRRRDRHHGSRPTPGSRREPGSAGIPTSPPGPAGQPDPSFRSGRTDRGCRCRPPGRASSLPKHAG